MQLQHPSLLVPVQILQVCLSTRCNTVRANCRAYLIGLLRVTVLTAVNDGQTACPNLNSSTLCRITVNVTSLTPGLFNASIPKGLCSVGQTVYTNDSLPAITGSRGLITIVYIPTSGLTTTVRIAYGNVARIPTAESNRLFIFFFAAFSGIYLSSSDHIAVNSSDPPPLDYIWEVYGVTGSTVLCQLESDGRLTDAPATLIPFDTLSPTCIYVAPYVKATRLTLTSKMQPVAPGNYTLVLTNDTCTSPFLLRSPPLFYTGKYSWSYNANYLNRLLL